MSRKRVQFCPLGHNTFITGRTKRGRCYSCQKLSSTKWNKINKNRLAKLSRIRYSENSELRQKISNCSKNRYINLKKDEDFKILRRNRKRAWKKKNPGKVALDRLKHTTNRNLRIPKFGQAGIVNFYTNCPRGYEVDHIIPLQGKVVSGLHVIWNLQYLSKEDNRRKGNKVIT